MRYSTEPRGRIYIKGYGFLSFAKNIGKNLSKNLSSKYKEKLLNITSNAFMTTSKRAIQKNVEETGDLDGNKNAEKIGKTDTKNAFQKRSKKICTNQQVYLRKYTHPQKSDSRLLMKFDYCKYKYT